jgi:hypothetical protein
MKRAAKIASWTCVVLSLTILCLAVPTTIVTICVVEYDRLGVAGLVAGAFAAVLCLTPLMFTLQEARSIRRRRQKILATRPPMSDEEFLAGLDVPVRLHPVCVRVRRALAAAVGLPPDLLAPGETVQDYGALQSVGPDLVEISFAIQEEFGFKAFKEMANALDRIVPWARPDRLTVGQFGARLTVWLADNLPDLKAGQTEKATFSLSNGEK